MKKCKITVLKTTLDEKLAEEYGDWIRKPGVAIVSCNDGLRPVIFKVEITDEEAELDYIPVR